MRKRAEHSERLEEELASARVQLDRIERELAGKRARRSPSANRLPVALGMFAMVGFIWTASALRAASHPSMGTRGAAFAPALCAPSERVFPIGVTGAAAHAPSTVTEPQTARWTATVLDAQDVALSAGDRCEISATLHGAGQRAQAPDVVVRCSATSLYASSARMEGTPAISFNVEEAAGPFAGKYALAYRDDGPRSGARSQVSIDTASGRAAVWSDSPVSFRVDLAVERVSDSEKLDIDF
jgi:hypothetical protein